MRANDRSAAEATTFRWDRVRGFLFGIMETGYGGFALIIAIEVFAAPDTVKSIVAAAVPIGLFLNPLSLSLFARLSMTATKIAGAALLVCSVLLLVSLFARTLIGFLLPACLAFALSSQTMPLLLHAWTGNYPSSKRGSYVAVSFMFSVASTFVFSLLGGWLLDREIEMYRWVLAAIAAAYALAGLAVARIPSTPISRAATRNPIACMGYAFSDWKFGVMLLAWMFLGFGNLMLLPLRFEYLLQPKYGVEASALMVTTLTLAVPAAFRFLSSRFWGALFDRINFMAMRIILNLLIMLSIALFFTTTSIWMMSLGAAALGVAMGGANISWSLWVTKFAPPERTAAYMSVHSFTTGIRGILAPFLGFYLIGSLGAAETGIVGCGLILISIAMVAALYRHRRGEGAEG